MVHAALGYESEPPVGKHRGRRRGLTAERFTVDADVDFGRALALIVKGGPEPSEKGRVDPTDEREADHG